MGELNMSKLKAFLILFPVVTILISSCNSNAPYAVQTSTNYETKQQESTFTLTFPPEPTSTKNPTSTPTISPTKTILPTSELGLIVTLGEYIPGPWSW